MDFGLFIFPSDTTLQPVEAGRAAEEAGFESLFFPEHSHIPTSRATPWGGVADAPPLPHWYWRSLDPFVALGAVAATTNRLKLGTGITLVAQRDPIWLAKEVASLDQISGGRVIFGIGYGWNKEELASHGVAYERRRAVLRERILMMKSLWTEEVASFDGDLLHLEPSWAWPKPVQKPYPPIIMGGAAGPKTIADMVEFCDGWMPLGTRHDLDGNLSIVRKAVEAGGRDPSAFNITAYGVKGARENVEHLIELGIDRIVFNLPQREPAEVLDRIGILRDLIAGYA
ncbi:MAG TPA: LLM class F420-dependent oxidoreductase [Acidimicrobiia bacterium]|nr:LLM class F420-dependent oxidoreductase [Acidimicrobiia bacterium]